MDNPNLLNTPWPKENLEAYALAVEKGDEAATTYKVWDPRNPYHPENPAGLPPPLAVPSHPAPTASTSAPFSEAQKKELIAEGKRKREAAAAVEREEDARMAMDVQASRRRNQAKNAYLNNFAHFLNVQYGNRSYFSTPKGPGMQNNSGMIEFAQDAVLNLPAGESGSLGRVGHITVPNNNELGVVGVHLTIAIPNAWIEGTRDVVMHVYRNGSVNFRPPDSPAHPNAYWLNSFNILHEDPNEAASQLVRLAKEGAVSMAGKRLQVNFPINHDEVVRIITNIRRLLSYINEFSPANPIAVRWGGGGNKTRKRQRKQKTKGRKSKVRKSKVRKSKRVKRKTRKQ